jgi:hypothetical protein
MLNHLIISEELKFISKNDYTLAGQKSVIIKNILNSIRKFIISA